MAIMLRRYAPEDADTVVDLWSRASKLAHPFIAGEGEGERARLLREVYLVHAENWVAVDERGRVVGLLGLLATEEDAEIGGLFVAPEAQGRGVGRLLVEHAAALKGPLRLEVFEENHGARRFYRRVGFLEGGRRIDDDTGHALLLLRRSASAGAAGHGVG